MHFTSRCLAAAAAMLLLGATFLQSDAEAPSSDRLLSEAGSGESSPPPSLPPSSPVPPSPPPVPPAPPGAPPAPSYPPYPPGTPGVECTTCMNARSNSECREKFSRCVLDAPSWSDWVENGLAPGSTPGAATAAAWSSFVAANATYTAGLAHRSHDGHCAHGHTDHDHANTSSFGLCRDRMMGDTCQNLQRVFLCVCVAEEVSFAAQDPLGRDQRFNFVMIGMICCMTAAVMMLSVMLNTCRDYLRRRFARGQLRPIQKEETDKLSATVDKLKLEEKRAGAQVQHELMGLWQCACCTTCFIAFVGGPVLLLLALPGSHGYWVGCGFPIPRPVVARPEFELGG